MRCALCWNEDKALADQSVSAWGELQSLKETPSYKEADIRDSGDRRYFHGYKAAIDDVVTDVEELKEGNEISDETYEWLMHVLAGKVAMLLFSILDSQHP